MPLRRLQPEALAARFLSRFLPIIELPIGIPIELPIEPPFIETPVEMPIIELLLSAGWCAAGGLGGGGQ